MTFNNAAVYDNGSYSVVKEGDPVVIKGEPMNWAVVNNRYGTVEATTSALPNAIMIADQFHNYMEELLPSGNSH